MKKSLTMIGMALAITVLIAGCSKNKESAASEATPTPEPIGVIDEADTKQAKEGPGFSEADEDTLFEDAGEIGGISAETLKEAGNEETDEGSEEPSEEDDADTSEETAEKESSNPNAQPIVWLGDSLTQGSLGDNNDNLPGAPYETLKKLVNVPVEGYGLYGYNTNDIFWVYMDSGHYNQTIDPKKTYIFWVGSNDWVVEGEPNNITLPVIAQIDRFLTLEGQVNNYIVIGTTARYELGDMYRSINRDLAAKYGSHYLDVIDVIGKDGYGPDRIHLTQGGYDAVARAVYEKLKSLGYI